MNTFLIRHMIAETFTVIRQTLTAAIGWLFAFPLTRIIRRDPNLTVVISRPESGFADNSKYFFINATQLARGGERVIMLTEDRFTQSMINDAGGESVLHPSWRSLCLLLRCGTVVTDWVIFSVHILACGARLVQIWHGAPLKHIELDVYRKRLAMIPVWVRPFLKIQKAMIRRYPVYDVVVATSQRFIAETFQRCFKARQFIATGYPRNDILFGWPDRGSMAYRLSWINVDQQAMEKVIADKSRGYTICLYVPTFRKDLANPFESKVELKRLSAFAQRYNLLIVLKLHPLMHAQYEITNYPNLIEYAPLKDVYPLMALSDILITDYSSIFFDFLLLDRPILFFAYDLEQYLSQDREMYFNYDTMTPGAICHSYDELELQLKGVVERGCKDQYAEMRMKVRSYTHDYIDNQASIRLIHQHLKNLT
jgi:CDP-glycerol glycerophosphotransferase